MTSSADSDVIHLDLAGTHVLVVNTAEADHDLFDKRAAIYSGKVPSLFALIIKSLT